MKENLARLISNIINPFVVSAVVLVLLAFESASGTADAFKWILISVSVSVLPVLIVVFILVRLKKLDSFFNNPREQRNRVYLYACLLGAIDCSLFWWFRAPELLEVVFFTSLVAVVVFMAINYFWKISLHTAFIAAAVALMIIIYRASAAWSLVFLPLVGWARIVLKQHSPAQVIVGGLVAAGIVVGVFWGFGQI